MSWVDLIIVVLLIMAIVKGLRAGLLELVLSFVGLILGLFAGSRLAQLATSHISSQLARALIIISLEFGLATALWMGGLVLSRKIEPHRVMLNLGKFNELAGGLLNFMLVLAVVWLAASGLSNVRSYGLGRAVRQSFVIRGLDTILPAPPDVVAQLEKLVSPNGFPDVFLGLEPSHTTVSPKNRVDNQAVIADEASVVKVQGVGCGAVVYGSGFVAAKGLVVTNAHVVAGITRPQVVDSQKTYRSTPVWFDPKLDIAVLKVDNLPDPPLNLAGTVLPDNSAAATLGFPEGGSLSAEDAVIIDRVNAGGRDIYNHGVVYRDIYEVQTGVQQGDSGGPLLAPDGSVAGVMFARSVSQDNIGYALLINQIKQELNQAKQSQEPADTGFCT